MTKIVTLFAALTVAFISSSASANPTGNATYLARAGSGTACTKTAPCTFMGDAIDAAGDGGEVICLDKGAYGNPATITHSVTISCGDGLWETSGNGFGVNAPAGSRVDIEGLIIDCRGDSGSAFIFAGSGTLSLLHVRIGNTVGPNSNGLLFQPTGAGKLVVRDSVFYKSGASGTGGGIVIRPQGAGTAQVTLEQVTVHGNVFGIAVDGSTSTGGINMTVADSVLANNVNDGLVATTSSGQAPVGVYVKNTKSINNAFGIRSLGSNVTVRVDGSSVMGNGTGLSFSGGGILATYGNNAVNANAVNGAFSGSIPLQ